MHLWQWKVMFQEGKGVEDEIRMSSLWQMMEKKEMWLEEQALKGMEED